MSLYTESVNFAVSKTNVSGGGVDVDFDASLVVQIGLFLVLLFVLKPVLFDPMLKLFEERERRIEGARLLARKTDEASAGALAKYESAMQAARADAGRERDQLRAEGVTREQEILSKVRAATAETMSVARAQLNEELTKTRASLTQDVSGLSRDLAARVLGREVH